MLNQENQLEEKIGGLLKETKEKVDPIIKKILNLYVEPKYRPLVQYQIFTGGKRLRPALAILSYRLCGGKSKEILYPAAGLEILHVYSLIIDDIIDESKIRRGQPTLWKKYGRSISECIAIDYVASAFQAINFSKFSKKLCDLFIKTAKISVNGEILDLLLETKRKKEEPYINQERYSSATLKDYLKMISLKTSLSTQTCCEVGGVCAGASQDKLEKLRKFGFYLGIAGQIRDDILDIFGEKEKFGKEIGHDIKEGKLGNILIVLALEKSKKEEREKILEIMKRKEPTQEEIKKIVEFIKKENIFPVAQKIGENFIKKAKGFLKDFPENKWKKLLFDLADFIIKRER
jgi:geranylgeranyl diphosphate synthase type I